ncbi:MAG: hypothetical protein ACTSQI_21795 [Candidatus Helarchaeota archaeon]
MSDEKATNQFALLYRETCESFGLFIPIKLRIRLVEKVSSGLLRVRLNSKIMVFFSSIMLLVSLFSFYLIPNIYLTIMICCSSIFAWAGFLEIAIAISILRRNLTLKLINIIKLLGYIGDFVLIITISLLIQPENLFSRLAVIFAGMAVCLYEWINVLTFRLATPANVLIGSRRVRCLIGCGTALIFLLFYNSINLDVIIGVSCVNITIICFLGAVTGARRHLKSYQC